MRSKAIRKPTSNARIDKKVIGMELGTRLKLLRVAADIKQRDLADRLSVSANYVSMVERGKREPTLKFLRQFASTVNVPLSFLFWEPEADWRSADERKRHLELDAIVREYAKSILKGIEKTD